MMVLKYILQLTNIIKRIVNYIQQNKCIPLETTNDCLSSLHKLVPTDKTCCECKADLGRPTPKKHQWSHVKNINTYFVKCNDSGMYYRCQKHCHGIHNYNGIFLIGIDYSSERVYSNISRLEVLVKYWSNNSIQL